MYSVHQWKLLEQQSQLFNFKTFEKEHVSRIDNEKSCFLSPDPGWKKIRLQNKHPVLFF
jgi:hypothetical protein